MKGDVMTIIDCDQHLYESRTTWLDHCDPSMREEALSIEDDEEVVQAGEPESSIWLRFKLWLLTHLVPENLL